MHSESNQKQVENALNVFYGVLKGLDRLVKIETPKYVYHYTSSDNFRAILKSEVIRFYTISNFIDKNERKIMFDIEKQFRATYTDNNTGHEGDLKVCINNELSNDHVFIQSNCIESENQYLWKNYGEKGKGICLKLSTSRFINYLNKELTDFDLLPDYFKCCYVSYYHDDINEYLKKVLQIIKDTNSSLGSCGFIIFLFFVEYWRNFIKTPNPYAQEKEYRFVVSDNYSVFLYICSVVAKWGVFNSNDKEDLSYRFKEEYEKRKLSINEKLLFDSFNGKSFVTIPLYEILDSIIIGSNSNLTKTDISELSYRKIAKSLMRKSTINTNNYYN